MQPQHPPADLKPNSTSSLSAQPPGALPAKDQWQPSLLSRAHSQEEEELQKPWDHDIPRERPQKTGHGGFGQHGQRLNVNYFGRGMCKGISLAAGSARASRHRLGGTAGHAWLLGTALLAAGQDLRTQQCPAALENADPGRHCHGLLKLNQSQAPKPLCPCSVTWDKRQALGSLD